MNDTRRIDPRLRRQLDNAAHGELVYALVVVPEAATRDVLADACAAAGSEFALVRDLPRTATALVAGPRALIEVLIGDSRVALASATTIDMFPWS